MKPLLPFLFLVLSTLLTACPSAQTPVPTVTLTGDWSGTLTHTDGQNVAIPLTVTLTQMESDLGGTGLLGPSFYNIGGDVAGKVAGTNVTFAFSYLAAEGSMGGEVTQTMGTYSFTGSFNENTLSGDIVRTIEGSELSVPGTFTLKRQ